MESKFATLKLLAYRGAPLNVTVTPGPDNKHTCTIERDGYFVHAAGNEQTVRDRLRHYPGPVTVNGEPLKTTPFPDLAALSLTTFDPPYTDEKEVRLDYDSMDPQTIQYNAYAGGVLSRIQIPGTDPFIYHSPDPDGPHGAWQKAILVKAYPVHRIETDELNQLKEGRHGGTLFIPIDHEMSRTLTKRAEQQFQRSILHPKAPPRHQGDIHRYFLSERNASPFDTNIPIIVHGTPVLLNLKDQDTESHTSLAAALYRNGGDLVPVRDQPDNQPPLPNVTHYQLDVQEEDGPKGPAWQLEAVKEIIIQLETDQLGARRIQADYDIAGPSFFNTQVKFLRHRADRDELAQALVVAYWDDEHYPDWDCMKEGLNQRERQVNNMIEAAFGDPDKAFTDELAKLANSFHHTLPAPDHPLSAESHDKRILVTYTPRNN